MTTKLGYLIVKKEFHRYPKESHIIGYRGIDRQPLTVGELTPLPEGYDEEKNAEILKLRNEIATQMEEDENEDGFITDFANALKYYRALKAFFPDIELLFCLGVNELRHKEFGENDIPLKGFEFIGYEVAYKQEDFFSAIRNGLLGNMYEKMRKYVELLNHHKLFDKLELAKSFMDEYLMDQNAEAGDFILYKLYLYK